MSLSRPLPSALALLAVGALAACAPRPDTPPNLLLITVDSLRGDRLGHGGNGRPTSPAVDRLAAEGIRFERAYSQSGWTLPSLASLLTGRDPAEHGATDVNRSVDDALPTLTTLLRERGYDTRAYVSHVLLRPAYGLASGFDVYDHSVLQVGNPHKVATAEPLTDRALADLASLKEPFFVWVHYFDPHFAYLSHPEWAAWGDRGIDRYDGEIAHTDRQIGRLLDAFEARGLDRRTVTVFTADHGEEFGEHGGKFHYSLYEEVARVPLVVRAPGLPPGKRSEPGEQVDLLPTLLGLLGIDADPGGRGRNLLAGDDGAATTPPLFLERERPPPYLQRAVIQGDLKLLVVSEGAGTAAEGAEEGEPVWRKSTEVRPGIHLFDLAADPGETVNLWTEDDPRGRELLALLEEHFGRERSAGGRLDVDEETRDKLRSLGYLQ